MKNHFIHFSICLLLTLSSCDDFFEEDISDKTIQVVFPTDGISLSSNQVSFAWNEQEGAEKYHVVVVTPAFENIQNYVCDTLVDTNIMKLDLPDGDYQWSIQAENFGYKSQTNYLTFKITPKDEK